MYNDARYHTEEEPTTEDSHLILFYEIHNPESDLQPDSEEAMLEGLKDGLGTIDRILDEEEIPAAKRRYRNLVEDHDRSDVIELPVWYEDRFIPKL